MAMIGSSTDGTGARPATVFGDSLEPCRRGGTPGWIGDPMLPATTKLMSADDHMIEPPHLWVDRVLAKYRDRCPRIEQVDGRDAWLYEDERTYIAMGSCRPLP